MNDNLSPNRRYKSDDTAKHTLQRSIGIMSKTVTRHTPPAAGPQYSDKMRNQEFARKLFNALVAKGWKQSRLAKECFGTTKTVDGYTVAKGRDRISAYVRGIALPDPVNLNKIAKALDIPVEELAPDIHFHTATREEPDLFVHRVPGSEMLFAKWEGKFLPDYWYKIYGLILENDNALLEIAKERRAKRAKKSERSLATVK